MELSDDGCCGRGVEVDGAAGVACAGAEPHRVQTFKLSNDPRFDGEKLVVVVGLSMNPPEKAIV